MTLTAGERRTRASIGGLARAAKYDGRELMEAANAALAQRWLDEVDPDRVLPEAERLRRATAARRAHMRRLSLASARARRARRDLGAEIAPEGGG